MHSQTKSKEKEHANGKTLEISLNSKIFISFQCFPKKEIERLHGNKNKLLEKFQ